MHIAGIHISSEHPALGAEGVVTSSLFIYTAAGIYLTRSSLKVAEGKGGQIKSMPTSLVGKFVTPMHGVAIVLPAIIYLVAVPLNGYVQPHFMTCFALPNFGLNQDAVNSLRAASCVGLIGTWKLFSQCISLLRNSGTLHSIGVREKPKLISSGPFALVRHPLGSCALLQELILAGMTWNFIPLCAFAVCALAFAVKAPIEESLMESDAEIGPQYKTYKEKVPYRFIPRIW